MVPLRITGKEHPVTATQNRLPRVKDVISKSHPRTNVGLVGRHKASLRKSSNHQGAEGRRQLLVLITKTDRKRQLLVELPVVLSEEAKVPGLKLNARNAEPLRVRTPVLRLRSRRRTLRKVRSVK